MSEGPNASATQIPTTSLGVLLPLCLLFFFNTGSAWSNDPVTWKGWRGPNQDFTVENGGLFPPGEEFSARVVWRKPLGQGYSAVSVDERMAVTMFSDGISDLVIALDPNNGSELWRHPMGPKHPGRFGSADGSISTPLIHEGRVIALSAHGVLMALDSNTGRKLWEVDLVKEYGSIPPYYGFGTSPLAYGDRVIVELGGTDGKAVAVIDPNTGTPIWASVTDTIAYQSPTVSVIHGRDQLIGVGNRYLTGLDPETGDLLWQYSHDGTNSASGNEGANLVSTGPGRFYWKNRGSGGLLLSLAFVDHGYSVEEVWKTTHIKGTYLIPVYQANKLFGYNGRILTCIDAQTGDRLWRSREPGDGLPIVVDGHLVIATKNGKLSIAPVSDGGYNERIGLDLFDTPVWAPPAFANGQLYIRSMSEIACVKIVPKKQVTETTEEVPGIIPGSTFAAFVQKLEGTRDKKSMLDDFMSDQASLPLIKGHDLVHFIYRGEAKEMVLHSDFVGWRYEQPMHQVMGTDLYYYSCRLEQDARVTYRFTRNIDEAVIDSLNPKSTGSGIFGKASRLHVPGWRTPEHLREHTVTYRGKIDTLTYQSRFRESSIPVNVYLPPKYDTSQGKYPVVYIHDGSAAQTQGQFATSLDYLIGRSVRPTIVVFIPRLLKTGSSSQYIGNQRDKYLETFVNDLIPAVEQKYRTVSTSEMRANMGCGFFGGFMAFYATFSKPGTVGLGIYLS